MASSRYGKYGNPTGEKFRLSICLKQFFADERARCYISADAGLRFRWLEARLRRLFALRGPLCLRARGHLLPPDEPLRLLAHDDIVEVIPKQNKIFPETSESELSGNELEIEKTNYHNESIYPKEISNKEESKAKCGDVCEIADRTTCDVSHTGHVINQGIVEANNKYFQNVQIINDNENDESRQCKRTDREKLEKEKRKALELLDQFSESPKRKRKRVRRRKQVFAQGPAEDTSGVARSEDVCDGPDKSLQPFPSAPAVDTRTTSASGDVISEKSIAPALDSDTLILRNNTAQGRSRRLVYSLS